MILNTSLGGDRAREGAFSQKPPKTAEKPPNLYIKNGWLYALRLTFIFSRIILFLSNLSVSKAIDQQKPQKTPKTADNRQNHRIHMYRMGGRLNSIYPSFCEERPFF